MASPSTVAVPKALVLAAAIMLEEIDADSETNLLAGNIADALRKALR